MTHPYYVIRPPGQPERIAQTAADAWRAARIIAAITGADVTILRADASGPLRQVIRAPYAWSLPFHMAERRAGQLAALLADEVVIVARGRCFDILPADDVNVSALATIGARYVARVAPSLEIGS
jgi:hypothetical protein